MGRYLVRRALFGVLVLLIISFVTFLIFMKLPPGDPARRLERARLYRAERVPGAVR